MDFTALLEKRKRLDGLRKLSSREHFENFDQHFTIEYAHNSTAIEGNTLTLIQTKLILEDGLSVGGKELREIYEIINHNKAFDYVKKCVADGKPLDENIVKDIHALLMESIMIGGIYRNVDVYISGAGHTPPTPNEMYSQIKNFYTELSCKSCSNPIALAAWTHAEFVKIHPFIDGNGRTSRLIMNYQLMANGFLPVSIAKENRLEYYEALEEFALNGNLNTFADIVATLEEKQLDDYLSLALESENVEQVTTEDENEI